MARVLVTGGTGMLGTALVPVLLEAGHQVRVLSRHGRQVQGASAVVGDVRTGAGLEDAVDGVDTVIHAATSPSRGARRTEVDGARNVVEHCARTGAHLIYVSIVGVDRHRFPYYRAKWAAEQIIEASRAGWSIQRATQFHGLVDRMVKGPMFISTPNLAFQPVDPPEVSGRLAELVSAGPSGRVDDFGGPEVLSIRALADTRRRVTGRRTALIPVPRLGFLRDFDAGSHLCPDHRAGHITWEQWLCSRRPSRSVDQALPD